MRLVKIYANKNFKNIEFEAGFNVVLATTFEKQQQKDTHGLGKTSLIHVINFLLLGKFNDKIFGNELFKGVIFFAEIELNNGNYLIIKRGIDNNSKISFKVNDIKNEGFIPPQSWDDENMPFEKAKRKLNELLAFNIVPNYEYRKSITYFLRTQQDYLDVYRLDKFKGKHIDWKPFVFELLGYDSKLIIQKLTLEEEIDKKKETIRILKEEARININDRDKLAGLLDIKEQQLNDTKANIDKFNFFQKDQFINKDLIENLDHKIQILNTERYRVTYDLNKIEESLANIDETVSIGELEKLHSEANLLFPEALKKDFSDLLLFNEAISKERKKYLHENLATLKAELIDIQTQLKQLETEKSEKLSFLTEKDSYAKFKEYQKNLAKLEAEVERIKDKIMAVDNSIAIESEISEIQKKVEESITQIRKAVNKRKHADINKIFNAIITDVLGTNALISINQNKQGNIEYGADYQNPEDLKTTSEAQGTSYKKLLCMAFDLALLIHYANQSFFRFVYHDGILEGLDDRIKVRILNKVKEICREYNLQYILSLIDSDIPLDEAAKKYEFSQGEICLQLNDKDDSGKLFLHSF